MLMQLHNSHIPTKLEVMCTSAVFAVSVKAIVSFGFDHYKVASLKY